MEKKYRICYVDPKNKVGFVWQQGKYFDFDTEQEAEQFILNQLLLGRGIEYIILPVYMRDYSLNP